MSFEDEIYPRIERIENQLKEIVNWLKLANKPILRELLIKELDSEEKKKVYDLTDGTRSQSEIEGLSKVTRRMVGYYWQKWYGLGILVPSDQRKGRMQKIVTLDEMAINVINPSEKNRNYLDLDLQTVNFGEILYNEKLFPTLEQLYLFSSSILPLSSIEYQNLSRSELVDLIINAFAKADKLKQNLFLQALERRAVERESTEFSKFFDSWARQIGK